MLVTAPSTSSVPVPNSDAVVDAARTTFPMTDPAIARHAANAGKRQSTPRPARRTTIPTAQPSTTVIHGNTRPLNEDNDIQIKQNAIIVIRPATVAARKDCAFSSLSPSSAVASRPRPSPCFLRNRRGWELLPSVTTCSAPRAGLPARHRRQFLRPVLRIDQRHGVARFFRRP